MERPAAVSTVDKALLAALGLLLLGVGLGAAMRVSHFWPALQRLMNGHVLHAHSHTLYWGWAGLALFALFFHVVGAQGRVVKWVLMALAVQGVATWVVFGRYGYGPPGVILSALTLFPFGAAVGLFCSRSRGLDDAAVPFLRASVLYVGGAYVSALSRVALKVLHAETPLRSAVAVHLFLGAFGGFFVLGLMGLTVRALGVNGPDGWLRDVLRFAAPLLPWPSLLALPALEGTILEAWARIASVALLIPAGAWVFWVWRHSVSVAERWLWRSAAMAWMLGCVAMATVGLGLLPSLVYQRHAMVAVVHLQTLGVVTASLLLMIERRLARPARGVLWLHQVGVVVMLVGLGLAAHVPGVLRLGLGLAALGGLGAVWAQGWVAWRFAVAVWRTTRLHQFTQQAVLNGLVYR